MVVDSQRIARVAYDARRSFYLTQGHPAHPEWFQLERWQRQAFLNQVRTAVINPRSGARELHGLFLEERAEAGWQHGPCLDRALKRDPFFLTWDELSPEDRHAEELVIAVVDVFRGWRP